MMTKSENTHTVFYYDPCRVAATVCFENDKFVLTKVDLNGDQVSEEYFTNRDQAMDKGEDWMNEQGDLENGQIRIN